jgi:ABC-type dipeptide/oligopeptide/nickel transport system permease subunit
MLFFPLRLGIPSGLFQSDFYRHFSFTPCLLTIPHMLLYLITVTIFKADYKF